MYMQKYLLRNKSLKGGKNFNPSIMWLCIILSASAPACYNLIPILTSGEVFGMHTDISITLFDNEQAEEYLKTLVTEMQTLVSPFLRSVSVCTRVEEAFRQAHVIIILDDPTDKEVYTLEDCIRSRVPLCRLYGYLIEKNAHGSVRVIVGGKTFVNLKTVLLMRYAPSIAHNVIAVALGVEGQAKAVLARKLKTVPACEWPASVSVSVFKQHDFKTARENTVHLGSFWISGIESIKQIPITFYYLI